MQDAPRVDDAPTSRRFRLLDDDLIKAAAQCWIALAALYCAFDFPRQLTDGFTNGAGRPFGDDYVNYWSAAYLALHGQAKLVYDWTGFHAFQQSVVGEALGNYHYSYPPVLLLLSAPLGALPYLWGWAAWTLAGWYAFYRALIVASTRKVILLALATPAILLNTICGQNGTWTAALLGGGLVMIDRHPRLAGVLFGLLIYKPHFGLLLPIALIVGRRWQTFTFAALTTVLLVGLTVVLYGADVWQLYLFNLAQLRTVILEDGTGVWHRMMSIFVASRRLGADVPLSYAIQFAFGLVAAIVVAWSWWRGTATPALRNALFILGTCLTTPYLQDYDFPFAAFVAIWLLDVGRDHPARLTSIKLSIAGVMIGPLLAAPLGVATDLAFGPLFFLPAFLIACACLWQTRPAHRIARLA